jgi:hypothetical protein
MRMPGSTVRFSVPFAAVEQFAQSVRETAAASFVARIRSEADFGP